MVPVSKWTPVIRWNFHHQKKEHKNKVIAHLKNTTMIYVISRCSVPKGVFFFIKKFSPVRSPLSSHLCGCKTSKLNPLLQTAHFVNLWEINIFTFKLTWLFKYGLLIVDCCRFFRFCSAFSTETVKQGHTENLKRQIIHNKVSKKVEKSDMKNSQVNYICNVDVIT